MGKKTCKTTKFTRFTIEHLTLIYYIRHIPRLVIIQMGDRAILLENLILFMKREINLKYRMWFRTFYLFRTVRYFSILIKLYARA